MRRWHVVFVLSGLLVLTGCSNENFSPYGAAGYPSPIMQAPYPSPGMVGAPGPYAFQPQIPPGFPPQYYPFLPIDNYFRSQPQITVYWVQIWAQWTQFAGSNGYSPYDFNVFWNDYCPSQWGNGPMSSLYNYFDVNFYSWMTPQTSFPMNVGANYGSYFWQGYSDSSFDYNICTSCF